jgi:hypothetical protein
MQKCLPRVAKKKKKQAVVGAQSAGPADEGKVASKLPGF